MSETLNAQDIAKKLQEQLTSLSATVDTHEVSTVDEVGDGIARVSGLKSAMAGELLEFKSSDTGETVFGLAQNLDRDEVGAVLFGAVDSIKEGDECRTTGRIMDIPVSRAMLGRVVNPLGQPIDGLGDIVATHRRPIEFKAPGVIDRTPVCEPVQTGLFAEQIFSGADGDIHYSYYLPDSYDGSRKFPMMVVMPGYNMMWFGEDSSGSNLNWNGFTAWTRLDTEMVVVSAQLTDWGEKSARQAIELTEYFINSFAVDTSRVYAAGYSAGGETMSRAVAMRPDLYAAYLHGASQWDGSYAPIAENSVAIYIYMADGDEYYGSAKARSAYENLHEAYENAGWSDADIDRVLRIETPDNAFFNEKGIYNYHGGANVVFDDPDNLNWVISHSKG